MKSLIITALTCCFSVLAAAQQVELLQDISSDIYRPLRIQLVSTDHLCLVEDASDRVRGLDLEGAELWSRKISAPSAALVDHQSRLLIGHEGRLDALDENGEILFAFGQGNLEFSRVNHIAIANDERVFVSDSPEDQIKVYDSDGHWLFSFGESGTQGGQFRFPTAVAFSPDGSLCYVIDQGNYRVCVYTAEGEYLSSFGQRNYLQDGAWVYEGAFTRLQGIAVDTAGHIFVSDIYQNNIQVLDAAGNFLSFIDLSEDNQPYFSQPIDLSIFENQLCVSSRKNSILQMFDISNFTGIKEKSASLPDRPTLFPAFPNPFNNTTQINFALPVPAHVEISLWNILGQRVRVLNSQVLQAGTHEFHWNGIADSGQEVASGVYICLLKTGASASQLGQSQRQRLLLVK